MGMSTLYLERDQVNFLCCFISVLYKYKHSCKTLCILTYTHILQEVEKEMYTPVTAHHFSTKISIQLFVGIHFCPMKLCSKYGNNFRKTIKNQCLPINLLHVLSKGPCTLSLKFSYVFFCICHPKNLSEPCTLSQMRIN